MLQITNNQTTQNNIQLNIQNGLITNKNVKGHITTNLTGLYIRVLYVKWLR